MNLPNHLEVFDDLTDDIKLCFIDIISIAEYFCPDIDIFKLDILPNLNFHENDLKEYFDKSEIEKILSFKTLKKQIEKMSGSIALKFLIQKYIHPQKTFNSIVTSNYEGGCPFVKDSEKFSVSVSHSKNMAVAALSLNLKTGIGVDLEFIRNFEIDNILKIVFSNRERDFYKDKSSKEIMKAFCFKEAYLKYIRKGFLVNPTNIELIDDNVFFEKKPVLGVHKIFKSIESNYILAIVFGEKGPYNIIN